jgi:hypothetical protein
MELGVVGYVGWEGCDESVEESDVAVAMGGGVVAIGRGFGCRRRRWWSVVVVEY